MTSNKFLKAAAAVTIAANAFLPFAAAAQSTGMPSGQRQTKTAVARDAQFCTALQNHQGAVGGNIDQRQVKLVEGRAARDTRMTERKNLHDAKMLSLREDQSSKRAEQYAKLDGLAETDDQKAAVSAFKTAAEAAITVRRAAVDVAMTTFKTGIDKAVSDRETKIDAWAYIFESSMKAALDKAKADCEAGVEPAVIRAALKTATDAARTKMQADRKAIDAVGQTVKTLTETRRTAVEKAHADFKAAMEKARTELKAALEPVALPADGSETNENGS